MDNQTSLAQINSKQIIEKVINNSEFKNDLTNKIIEENSQLAGKELENLINQKVIKIAQKLTNKVNKLKKLMTEEENDIKISLNWWRRNIGIKGIGNKENPIFYNIKNDEKFFGEAFSLINEIVALLRNEEEILLRISIYDKKGKVQIFDIKESKVNIGYRTRTYKDKRGVEHTTQELYYKLSEIQNQIKEKKISSAFQKHYDEFFNIGRKYKEDFPNYGINEGHITEAFYAHFDTINEDFTGNNFDTLTKEIVHPLVYEASQNKLGWWGGGDVANVQIKALNDRLASVQSVTVMANQILFLFSQDKFDWDRFNKIFTDQSKNIIADAITNSVNE